MSLSRRDNWLADSNPPTISSHDPIAKVMIAEEALRRAKLAGSLPAEGGRRAAEETIEKFRKDAEAAQARRTSLAGHAAPAAAAAAAAAERASQVAALIRIHAWQKFGRDGWSRSKAHDALTVGKLRETICCEATLPFSLPEIY